MRKLLDRPSWLVSSYCFIASQHCQNLPVLLLFSLRVRHIIYLYNTFMEKRVVPGKIDRLLLMSSDVEPSPFKVLSYYNYSNTHYIILLYIICFIMHDCCCCRYRNGNNLLSSRRDKLCQIEGIGNSHQIFVQTFHVIHESFDLGLSILCCCNGRQRCVWKNLEYICKFNMLVWQNHCWTIVFGR